MPTPFGPTVLYHRSGEVEEVSTLERFEELMEQEGWATSPAAHGVIGAPSAEERGRLPRVSTPLPPTKEASPAEAMAFGHLLQQWEHRLEALESECRTLRLALTERLQAHEAATTAHLALLDRVSGLEQGRVSAEADRAALGGLHAAHQALHERVQTMEQALTTRQQPAAQPAQQGGKR
jgi:hypothetical protein